MPSPTRACPTSFDLSPRARWLPTRANASVRQTKCSRRCRPAAGDHCGPPGTPSATQPVEVRHDRAARHVRPPRSSRPRAADRRVGGGRALCYRPSPRSSSSSSPCCSSSTAEHPRTHTPLRRHAPPWPSTTRPSRATRSAPPSGSWPAPSPVEVSPATAPWPRRSTRPPHCSLGPAARLRPRRPWPWPGSSSPEAASPRASSKTSRPCWSRPGPPSPPPRRRPPRSPP